MTAIFEDFHVPIRAVVIGATGGIGRAFVQALAGHDNVGQVFALARDPDGDWPSGVSTGSIDILDEASIEAAAARLSAEGALDLVLLATGMLHEGDRIQPEKSLRDFDAGTMTEVFALNAIAPALVAKHFLPVLRKREKTVFAALSARVGSISDNRLGGWASYRASKAALNMLLKTASIEHARRNRSSVVAALHPGTVDTRLSAPFQSNVPDERLFTPEISAGHLLDVVDGLTPDDSGGFFAWDGEAIPF